MTTGGEEGGENSSLGSIQIRSWQSYAGMKKNDEKPIHEDEDRQKSVMLTHFLLYLFLWLMLLSILFRRRKWDRILKQTKRYPDSGQERKQCSPLNKYVGINRSSLFFTGFLVLARWYL